MHHDAQLSSESPFIFKDQCGNVAVPVEQPIHVHFTDDEKVLNIPGVEKYARKTCGCGQTGGHSV